MALFVCVYRKRYPVSVSNYVNFKKISSLLKTFMSRKISKYIHVGFKIAIVLGLFYVYLNGRIIWWCAPFEQRYKWRKCGFSSTISSRKRSKWCFKNNLFAKWIFIYYIQSFLFNLNEYKHKKINWKQLYTWNCSHSGHLIILAIFDENWGFCLYFGSSLQKN